MQNEKLELWIQQLEIILGIEITPSQAEEILEAWNDFGEAGRTDVLRLARKQAAQAV